MAGEELTKHKLIAEQSSIIKVLTPWFQIYPIADLHEFFVRKHLVGNVAVLSVQSIYIVVLVHLLVFEEPEQVIEQNSPFSFEFLFGVIAY